MTFKNNKLLFIIINLIILILENLKIVFYSLKTIKIKVYNNFKILLKIKIKIIILNKLTNVQKNKF